MTDAEKIAELRADKESIIALLRACIDLPPERCRNTLREAVRRYDKIKLQQAMIQAND